MTMLRLMLVPVLAASGLVALGVAPSIASCHEAQVPFFTNGALFYETEIRCSSSSSPSGGEEANDAVQVVGTAACVAYAIRLGQTPDEFCGSPDTATVTPGLAAAALGRVPIPAARIRVQPPNGRTLVNFATNFYTDREEFTRVVRLLGQRVELRITPARFAWHFDDGRTVTTTSPGAPYPHLEVTHQYLRKGGVSPRVDTTYTAVFRVGGGGWRPVPGSVTIPGASVDLVVVEASPTLVGYN